MRKFAGECAEAFGDVVEAPEMCEEKEKVHFKFMSSEESRVAHSNTTPD